MLYFISKYSGKKTNIPKRNNGENVMEHLNVLVTGGARGIGAGIVEQLAGKGHNVAFCGRAAAESAEEVLKGLRSRFSGKFMYYQCDVSNAEDRRKLVDSFLADFG